MASVRKRTWITPSGETKTAWVVDYTDNRGDRQRKHFPTKKAADAFRINIESQLQSGSYRPDAGNLMLKHVCESFLAHCEGRYQRDERMTRNPASGAWHWCLEALAIDCSGCGGVSGPYSNGGCHSSNSK